MKYMSLQIAYVYIWSIHLLIPRNSSSMESSKKKTFWVCTIISLLYIVVSIVMVIVIMLSIIVIYLDIYIYI